MAPIVVVDASLIFRLLVPNPQQSALQALTDGWQQAGVSLVAPDLWAYELISTLVKVVHAGDMTQEEGRRMVHLVHAFPVDLISPDVSLSLVAYAWSRRLGRASAYDAFYLALAEAVQGELWTADRRLANAVRLEWVHCVV